MKVVVWTGGNETNCQKLKPDRYHLDSLTSLGSLHRVDRDLTNHRTINGSSSELSCIVAKLNGYVFPLNGIAKAS